MILGLYGPVGPTSASAHFSCCSSTGYSPPAEPGRLSSFGAVRSTRKPLPPYSEKGAPACCHGPAIPYAIDAALASNDSFGGP